jgi:4-hydroxy-2-oxoheptanedioate aldolase
LPNEGRLKKKLQAGEVVIGPFCIIPSMPMVESLGHAGMDFLIIDTEHGPIGLESAQDMCIAADAAGVAPIIRVGGIDEWMILRALDIGSAGVQVPQINTADDANAVVHAAKYDPAGQRGLSIFTRAGDYFANDGEGHTDRQNEETTVVVHIEGQTGLDNLDEIMTVDGIDVLFLGPYDISQSLGIPGQVRDKKVEDALRKAAADARSQGRAVGSYAKDVDMGKWLLDIGVQYLSINVDATIYMQACRSIVEDLRA